MCSNSDDGGHALTVSGLDGNAARVSPWNTVLALLYPCQRRGPLFLFNVTCPSKWTLKVVKCLLRFFLGKTDSRRALKEPWGPESFLQSLEHLVFCPPPLPAPWAWGRHGCPGDGVERGGWVFRHPPLPDFNILFSGSVYLPWSPFSLAFKAMKRLSGNVGVGC